MSDKQHVSGKTAVVASVAGLIIGAPLIGLTGMSFAATVTLLLLASPLFIIFSPVLFGAVCLLALALLGFGVAGAMALVGVSSVVYVVRSFTAGRGVVDNLMESGDDQNWLGKVQQKPYEERENMVINSL